MSKTTERHRAYQPFDALSDLGVRYIHEELFAEQDFSGLVDECFEKLKSVRTEKLGSNEHKELIRQVSTRLLSAWLRRVSFWEDVLNGEDSPGDYDVWEDVDVFVKDLDSNAHVLTISRKTNSENGTLSITYTVDGDGKLVTIDTFEMENESIGYGRHKRKVSFMRGLVNRIERSTVTRSREVNITGESGDYIDDTDLVKEMLQSNSPFLVTSS